MEISKNCTSKGHEKIEASNYCEECKIYICKKCESNHSILFPKHNIFKINEDLNQIFTGLCKEKNHLDKLQYFCKTHNILCCAKCITQIKDDENGQHNNCDICSIDNIKEEKKNNLNDNIKILEQLSLTIEESIKEIKNTFVKINTSKENIKLKIQKIFTKIRTQLNQREDELYKILEQKFDTIFFKEDIVIECDKLPNKIKTSLEKGKNIDFNLNKDNNKINSLINDCLNIENTIVYVKKLNDTMKKYKSINVNVNFIPEEKDMGIFIKTINDFGNIAFNNFKFIECPEKISDCRKYTVSGEKRNILIKTGEDDEWMGTICANELDKSKECIWKIKVLKSEEMEIMIGIAPKDFDINSSMYDNCGWYYYLYNNSLFCGPPQNYSNKKYKKKEKDKSEEKSDDSDSEKPKKEKKNDSDSDSDEEKSKKEKKNDSDSDSEEESSKHSINNKKIKKKNELEITVVFNLEKNLLQFYQNDLIQNEYADFINTDKPLFPAVFLLNKDDTIEIEGYY